MPKFKVFYKISGNIIVEADSANEAADKVYEMYEDTESFDDTMTGIDINQLWIEEVKEGEANGN